MPMRMQQLICGPYRSDKVFPDGLHAICSSDMHLNEKEMIPVLPAGHAKIMQLEAISCWKQRQRRSNNHHHFLMVQLRCQEGWQVLALACSSPCSAPRIARPYPARQDEVTR